MDIWMNRWIEGYIVNTWMSVFVYLSIYLLNTKMYLFFTFKTSLVFWYPASFNIDHAISVSLTFIWQPYVSKYTRIYRNIQLNLVGRSKLPSLLHVRLSFAISSLQHSNIRMCHVTYIYNSKIMRMSCAGWGGHLPPPPLGIWLPKNIFNVN